MIRVEILPAGFGDCILIEYGEAGPAHRILIDGGLKKTYEDVLRQRLTTDGVALAVDLVVVTHIDRDHIAGILPLLQADPAVIRPRDVWFNGREHLDDELGPKDGEALSKALRKLKLPWNAAFDQRAVVVPDGGRLPVRDVGGARITLLSPYPSNLTALARDWDDTLGHWDIDPDDGRAIVTGVDDVLGKRPPLSEIDVDLVRELQKAKFKEDDKSPNGSSIAFLFEYHGVTILFAADAHPSTLLRSLERHAPRVAFPLTAFKLSHHGSMANLSPELLDKIACDRFLISSSGDSFGHPNPETLARLVAEPGRTLCFNYASAYTKVWDNALTRRKFKYVTEFPTDPQAGYVLNL